jgi:uncharacterized protein (DUF362 family)
MPASTPALPGGSNINCKDRSAEPSSQKAEVGSSRDRHVKPKMLMNRINTFTRRHFLQTLTAAPFGVACGTLFHACNAKQLKGETFIAKAIRYTDDLSALILAGFRELQISPQEIRGKRILLKANIVEPHRGSEHIVTNPAVVFAAAEAFLKLGADKVIVAEGAGHCSDTYMILEESGFDTIFDNPKITFVDLNYDDWLMIPNAGGNTKLNSFIFPVTLKRVDWIISMPKLKTHHWVGATMSMKNLFGTLPGTFYGWPKNVLHNAGITKSIIDINATLRPHFAIVDGIVGMEGDGPIMGTPKNAGVLVMGRNLPAVDATCARLMGINPHKIDYLNVADNQLGPIKDSQITQRGERWESVRTNFQLLDYIDAQRGLRL